MIAHPPTDTLELFPDLGCYTHRCHEHSCLRAATFAQGWDQGEAGKASGASFKEALALGVLQERPRVGEISLPGHLSRLRWPQLWFSFLWEWAFGVNNQE